MGSLYVVVLFDLYSTFEKKNKMASIPSQITTSHTMDGEDWGVACCE